MAKNVIINGVTYQNVPEGQMPLASGSGSARFVDTDDATLSGGGQMLDGVTAYADGVKYSGTIQSKAAATYTPGTSDQTIAAGQYLAGAQTVKGSTNLVASNIRSGVQIFNVTGSLSTPTITQDQSTKVLTIQ